MNAVRSGFAATNEFIRLGACLPAKPEIEQ